MDKALIESDISINADPISIIMASLTQEDIDQLENLESVVRVKAGEIGEEILRDILAKSFATGVAFAIKNPGQVAVIDHAGV